MGSSVRKWIHGPQLILFSSVILLKVYLSLCENTKQNVRMLAKQINKNLNSSQKPLVGSDMCRDFV